MRKFFILAGIIFSCASLNAQSILKGRVLNGRNEPIVNAIVKLRDSSGSMIHAFAISDKNSFFQMRLPANMKRAWIECSFIGYRSSEFWLDFPAEIQTIYRDIILPADTVSLPMVNIFTTPPIKVSGDTTTFRVDAFKKGNESNIGDLLNNIPGFNVVDGKITYNGRSVSRVLVEDDDLFGTDYNVITQNLSTRGVEKIQLIENYNDKTYLANRLQKGNELVVNLKFASKYLYRVISSHEGGIGISSGNSRYRVKQNIVSLIPKIKLVLSTNLNNTGMLGSDILGIKANIPEIAQLKTDGIGFSVNPIFPSYQISHINDISLTMIPKEKMVFNHTGLVTGNLLYKVSPKLLFKGIIQYTHDSFSQSQSQTEDFNVSGVNLLVSSNQFLYKKSPFLNSLAQGIYNISKSTQLIYKFNLNSRSEADSLFDLRQTVNTYSRLTANAKNFQQELNLTIAPDINKLIDLRFFQNNQSGQQESLLFPAHVYSSITSDTFFSKLYFPLSDRHDEYTWQGRFTAKKNTTRWYFEATHTNSRSSLNSEINLLNPDSSFRDSKPALQNNISNTNQVSSVNVMISTKLAPRLSFQTTQKIETGSLGNQQFNKEHYLYYLPNLGFNFSISANQSINVNLENKSSLPQIYDLTTGSIFTTSNSVSFGNDTIRKGISRSVSASYVYADMAKKKMSLFILSSFGKDPLLYLSDRSATSFYTISNSLVSSKDVNRWTLYGNFYKYVSFIKSQITSELSFNNIDNFLSTNGKVGGLNLSGFMSSVKLRTLVTGKLTMGVGVKENISVQIFDKGTPQEIKSKVYTQTYSGELIYRFSSQWIFTSHYQYIAQQQGQIRYGFSLGDLSMKYTAIKDKLHFLVSGNNLFADKQFSSSYFTQYSLIHHSVALQRSYAFIQATIEL